MFNKEENMSYTDMTIAEALALNDAGFALLLENGEVTDIVKDSVKEA